MKYIALIPARGGSKGIPDKNIKDINGKPLISWSIDAALICDEISDVYVSTDSAEIKKIAIENGAKSPFLRPAEISGDKATTESAVIHFLDWCEENDVKFDNLVLMQGTSPFRYKDSLSNAIKVFELSKSDSLVSVTKTHKFIWKKPNSPTASYDIYNRPRRQDIKSEEEIFFENGSFYITKVDIYKKYGNRLGGKILMFEMSPEESYEIDDPIDIDITELMMRKYGVKNDN